MFKTYTLLFCLLCLSSNLSAQYLFNNYFAQFEKQPCPFSPGDTVNWPARWQLYQTTDGHWDGPIDSTRCITGSPYNSNYSLKIELKQIDPERPLFIRAVMDTLPAAVLLPNDLFNVYINAFLNPATVPLLSGEDCPDQLCSGALIGIAIPDEQGLPGGATRFQTGLLSFFSPNPNVCYVNSESCFPTERFDGQYFREFILKFTFDSTANLGNTSLVVSHVDLMQAVDPFFGIGYITDIPAYMNPINVYNVSSPSPGDANYLGLYTAPSYPGPQNLSYIEARPVPNVSVPQDITLTVEPWQTLEMQPFAQFRGGLVTGSDTLRHQFTLQNDGGDICLSFVDLIFDGGDAYHHAGGTVNVNNSYSCLQFKNGSEMRVKEGASLHYGKNGAGMLVICANSTIVLERNATLVLDAILQISECNDALPPSQIFMDLPPGAQLIFTENAWLTNRFSKQKQMQLNVRMLGGTLDDSALDPESKSLIRRIYPEPSPTLADNVQLLPNPFGGQLQLRYLAGADEPLRLRWFNVQGSLAREELFQMQKGWNERKPEGPLVPGFYVAEVSTPGGRYLQQMIRLKD